MCTICSGNICFFARPWGCPAHASKQLARPYRTYFFFFFCMYVRRQAAWKLITYGFESTFRPKTLSFNNQEIYGYIGRYSCVHLPSWLAREKTFCTGIRGQFIVMIRTHVRTHLLVRSTLLSYCCCCCRFCRKISLQLFLPSCRKDLAGLL